MPAHTLQINIGYDKSILELSGAYNGAHKSEYIYDGKTFGADKGLSFSVVSKMGLGKSKMVRFIQSASYNRILSYSFKDWSLADIGEANYNAYTVSLGMEYCFMPNKKFRVYFGGEFNASMINGDVTVWFERSGNPLGDSLASYGFNNSFRLGYGLNAGTEFIINRNIGLNLGIRLLNLNAFLKKADGSNDEKEFSIRDDSKGDLIFSGNKNFSFYSIYGGINFYFGLN